MRHRYVLGGLTLACTFFLVGVGWPALQQARQLRQREHERRSWQTFLDSLPSNRRHPLTRAQLKALPKKDRPDLAAEQDFRRTADPASRTVPRDVLFEVTEQLVREQQTRAPQPPLVTTGWAERGPSNVGGRTRALLFDPNDATLRKVWAGSVGGGLWYTNDITNPSEPWRPVNDLWPNLSVSSIAADPSDPQRLYVATGEGWFNVDAQRGRGLFRSTDGGATWRHVRSTIPFRSIQRVAVTSSGAVLASTSAHGVQRSTDGGATWSAVLAPALYPALTDPAAADLEVASDGTLYASTGIFSAGSVWRSDDDGRTWTQLVAGAFGSTGVPVQRIELAVAPSRPSVLYALAQSAWTYGVAGLYRSADRGATWQALALPVDCERETIPADDFSRGQAWYDLVLAVNPTAPNDVVAGAIDLFRTRNAELGGAATWTQLSVWFHYAESECPATMPVVHADQHAIAFRPGSSRSLVFGHDGGVTYLPNANRTPLAFVGRNTGYNVTQFYSAALHPSPGSPVMLGGTQDNGTQRFDRPGVGPTAEVQGGDGGFTFIDQNNPRFAIASYTGAAYYLSADGGVTFTQLPYLGGGDFINPADYDDTENLLLASYWYDRFYRCLDVTTTPSCGVLQTDLKGGFASAITTSPFSRTVFAGTYGGRLFRLTGTHSTSRLVAAEITGPINAGAVSNIDVGASDQQLLVTLSNYGVTSVYETLDGGATWTAKEGNLPNIPVRWGLYHPTDPARVLLATEVGLFETATFTSDAPTWRRVPGVPITRFDMLQERADGTVLAASHGRGFWTATWLPAGGAAAPPPVAEQRHGELPGTHVLSAPYPNPFNPQTAFTLSVARTQQVRIDVFDAAGRLIDVLHRGELQALTPHTFRFQGSGRASGTYFVRVTGETFAETKSMVLLK